MANPWLPYSKYMKKNLTLDVNNDCTIDFNDFDEIYREKCPRFTKMIGNIAESHVVKILLTLYQILSPVSFNLGVEFPPMVTNAMSAFDFMSLEQYWRKF